MTSFFRDPDRLGLPSLPPPGASGPPPRAPRCLKKSDLWASLWASCDELRGGMDANQCNDYVLFMLFNKYVSDKYGSSNDFAPPVKIPRGGQDRHVRPVPWMTRSGWRSPQSLGRHAGTVQRGWRFLAPARSWAHFPADWTRAPLRAPPSYNGCLAPPCRDSGVDRS